MALAIVLVILVVGSVLFHFFSPWWFTPIASNWSNIDNTVSITFWVTGIVFVVVNLFMAWCVVRYRHTRGKRAHYEPENKKLEFSLIGLTTIGIVAMLAPGLFVWANFVSPPDNAQIFEVVGQQWQWSYRFPGKDGEFGAVSTRHVGADNTLGIDPNDPKGQDDVVVDNPVLHLPLGQPVKALLRSKDVLHDFAVPQFRVKMDMVPGQVTYVWFTPTRTGAYELLCQELCGIAHFAMRGLVVVEPKNDFDHWLANQKTFAQSRQPKTADNDAGKQVFTACTACHGVEGEGNAGMHAPKLSGQSTAYLKRQIDYFRHDMRGSHALDTYGQQMVPMAAGLDDESVDNVVAYIATLPDKRAEKSVKGNAERGRGLYTTCGVCHGARGQGNLAQGVPRLAGMSDWYMARQLDNFKAGIRGVHPADAYGSQMRFMAAMLKDAQTQDDLLSYVNTL